MQTYELVNNPSRGTSPTPERADTQQISRQLATGDMDSTQGQAPHSSLEGLPPELRLLVAERVDVKDRRSLAKASRTMRNSTDPYVFQGIILSDSTEEMGRFKPVKLLRSLLAQPHLTKYVRFVRSLYIEEHFDCDTNNLSPEDQQTLQQARQACRSGYTQSADPGYKHHHFEAALALLLQLCPNLKEIHLGMTQANCDCRRPQLEEMNLPVCKAAASNPQDEPHRRNANHSALLSHPHEIFDVFRRAIATTSLAGGNTPFSRLTRVVLDVHPERAYGYRWSITGASPLFRLPCLKWLTIKGATFKLRMDVDKDDTWDCPENVSNIKWLDLEECELDTTTLCKILKSCKGLQDVGIFLTNGDVGESQFPWTRLVDWAMVSSALQNSRETLEYLSIRAAVYTGSPNDHQAPNDMPIGSLKAFEKLKCLSISDTILIGRTDGFVADVDYSEGSQGDFQIMAHLPTNLRCFHLDSTIESDNMAAALKQLARGLFANRRKLQSVSFVSYDCIGASNNELVESLRVACPSIEFKDLDKSTEEWEGHTALVLSHKSEHQKKQRQLLMGDNMSTE